ncbi:MAG: hypothetical protein ACYCPM_10105, partial [Acidobacteriaceae bacterium]
RIPGGSKITVPASTENIPVYVKTGSVIPWADVALYAEAPATRRLTARIYGNGSLPFEMGIHGETLRLAWRIGHGSATGSSNYQVHKWQQIG